MEMMTPPTTVACSTAPDPEPPLPNEPMAEAYNAGFALGSNGEKLSGIKYRGKKNTEMRDYYERGHADGLRQARETAQADGAAAVDHGGGGVDGQRPHESYADFLARTEQPLVPPETPETEGLETDDVPPAGYGGPVH